MTDAARLQHALGHDFRDPALLECALTHRSGGTPNNERLEFLGDAVLGFVVADALFQRCPRAAESRLTVMRSALVRRASLATVGRKLRLSEFLRVGTGERKGGVFRRDSVLADTVEALLAAVFVDAGYDAARAFVLRHFGADIERVIATGAAKDAKTRLQEHQQALGQPLPVYTTVARDGAEGSFVYRVQCHVPGTTATGFGADGDVRMAEQNAAAALLAALLAAQVAAAEQTLTAAPEQSNGG